MTFLDSVNTCLKKTLTISGRASRSEFWWFQLSFFVIGLIVGLIVAALGADSTLASIIGIIFALYVIVVQLHHSQQVSEDCTTPTDQAGWFWYSGC